MRHDTDPPPGAAAQPPTVTAGSLSGREPTDRNPLANPCRTSGEEPGSVIVRDPDPGTSRSVIVVLSPGFGRDTQAPGPRARYSVRKLVLAARPAGPLAGDADAGGGQPPFLGPPTTIAATATESTGVASAADPTGDSASSGAPRSAMINGLRWAMVGRPAVEAANLLQVAVLARLVAPAEFGRYAIALIVYLLANVPTQTVQYSIVQRTRIDPDHLKTGVTLTVLGGLAICALCFVASYTVVPVLFGARTAMLVRLMIPACFINSVNTVQIAMMTRRLEFRRLSLLDFTFTLVAAVTSIPMAAAGLNGEALVLGVLAGSIAGCILTCCWILPPVPNFCRRAARDLLHFGIAASSGAASTVCFQNCDYVIIGARLGALQAGYYFRAYSLSVVYQTKLSQVMSSIGYPVLARSTSEDEIDALRQRMVHTVTLVVFPLLTALAIVAPKFVTWFYGPAWHATVVPVQILAIGGAAMLVAEALVVAMLATGRARAVMKWGWAHFLAYAAIVFAVAPFGLVAIAVAAAVVHTAFLMISYLQLVRGSPRRAFATLAKDVVPAAASSVGLATVAIPVSIFASKLSTPTVLYLLIIAVAGGAGYFLSLRLWFPNQLRLLGHLAGRLLPAGTHRLFSRFIVRPQPQSAAELASDGADSV
jgi:lipopolysaccharide exporter